MAPTLRKRKLKDNETFSLPSPLQMLPEVILIEIFHHVHVRDFHRCQRLSKFFFYFLRHNFDAIQPEKIQDTDFDLRMSWQTAEAGRILFETATSRNPKSRVFLLKLDDAKPVKILTFNSWLRS